MDKPELLWFIPLMFMVTAAIPFIITMKLLAYFSGWERLAEHYRHNAIFDGKTYYRQSARIKWTSYKGCLKIGICDDGLYMQPIWIFSMFHKPLLIPWDDIKVEPYHKSVFTGCMIRMHGRVKQTIFLYGNAFHSFPNQVNSGFE